MSRLFAIVLIKFLSFGDIVDLDIYDFKTNSLSIKHLNWKPPSLFLDLINFCLQSHITTAVVTAFIRSICAYDFSTYQTEAKIDIESSLKNEDVPQLSSIHPQ